MLKEIFLLEDDIEIQKMLKNFLEKNGFIVKSFSNAESFLIELKKKKPNLILLDLMLPDADGIEVCKNLKSKEDTSKIPIIIISAKTQEIDKVIGLEVGADDYLGKPFSLREILARIKAVLRRQETKEIPEPIKLGCGLEIDPEKFKVFYKNEEIILSTTEFKILHLLASNKGVVFSREKIIERLWNYEKDIYERTIDVHIKHLREKLKEAGNLIKNIRGVGYKLEE
jgi:DNA-binding response OmpR family regulator